MVFRIPLVGLLSVGALCGAAVTHVWRNDRLAFEENRGQACAEIRHLAGTASRETHITTDSVVFPPYLTGIRFTGVDPGAAIRPIDPLPGVVNFVSGAEASNWGTGVPRYGRLELVGACPGVEVVYDGASGRRIWRIMVQLGGHSASPGIPMLSSHAFVAKFEPSGELSYVT